MKTPTEDSTGLSPKEWELLHSSIRDYNQYVVDRIKLIMDFDVWYEMTNGKDFPKEWYSMVKESPMHK